MQHSLEQRPLTSYTNNLGESRPLTSYPKDAEPRPLTYTNVTEHDRIWRKESPDHYLGLNNTEDYLSPPLKHITPESTQELWENFDPLDVLDSGSDSSADTMIMMTTEEERRNEERVKNSYLEYELRKKLNTPAAYNEYSHLAAVSGGGPPSPSSPSSSCNGRRNSEDESCYHDDGYGTDNRSNTTASLSSPLSSSLSSLLTSESSSSQGSLQRNLRSVQKQQHQHQQQQHQHQHQQHQHQTTTASSSNGRGAMNSNQNAWLPKRKARPVETQDNSLEEKLRALTTIVEEEGPAGDRGGSSGNQGPPPPPLNGADEDRGKEGYKTRNGLTEGENGRWLSLSATLAGPGDGFYRAVPVTVISEPSSDLPPTSPSAYDRMNNQGYGQQVSPKPRIPEDVYNRNDLSASRGSTSSSHHYNNNPHDWRYGPPPQVPDPSSPHSPHSPLSPHHLKNTNQEAALHHGQLSPRSPPGHGHGGGGLCKNPATMYSMPADLNTAGDPRGGLGLEGVTPEEVAAVRLRKSQSRLRPGHPNHNYHSSHHHQDHHRLSWDQSAASTREALSTSADNMTPVSSIIDLPKLETQMRACSELALGIKRPAFASSSDIYRLFQGQRQTPSSSSSLASSSSSSMAGRQSACRHSFHAMPSGSWQQSLAPLSASQDQGELRQCLKHASMAAGPPSASRAPSSSSMQPLKASHDIQGYYNVQSGLPGDRHSTGGLGPAAASYNGGAPPPRYSQGHGAPGGEASQGPGGYGGRQVHSAGGRSWPQGPVNGVGHNGPMMGGSNPGMGGSSQKVGGSGTGPGGGSGGYLPASSMYVQDGHVPYSTRTVADGSGEKLSTLV